MALTLLDTLKEWAEKLKDWTISNTNNPLFWLAAFVLGVAIFELTYDPLSK